LLETPEVTLEKMRGEKDDHSDDGSTQTVVAAREVDGTSSVVGANPHNEHDTGSMEMDDPRGAGQDAPVVTISVFGEAPLSIAECSPETPALLTVTLSASNLRKIGENDLGMVGISNFTTTKILDKRSSPCGIEYRCQLEPLWLPADLVKKVQMGRVHVRNYEKGLVRAARLDTLRKGARKRRHSQM
jgi:hypothetical protein